MRLPKRADMRLRADVLEPMDSRDSGRLVSRLSSTVPPLCRPIDGEEAVDIGCDGPKSECDWRSFPSSLWIPPCAEALSETRAGEAFAPFATCHAESSAPAEGSGGWGLPADCACRRTAARLDDRSGSLAISMAKFLVKTRRTMQTAVLVDRNRHAASQSYV